MNKSLKKLLSLLALTTLIFACTEKKNTIGFVPGTEPKNITFTTSDEIFEEYYSLEEEMKNYYENSRMYLGNLTSNGFDNQARILLKASALPDTVAEFVTAPTLVLNIDNNYMLENISATELITNKVNVAWLENEATWFKATDSLEWINEGGDFEAENLTENVEIIGDSLYVTIPQDLVQEWVETDSINYGLMLYTEETGMLKIKSSEFSDAPSRLSFDYKLAVDDTVKSYSAALTSDTFITSDLPELDKFENRLILSNLQPIASILKINLTDSLFINHPQNIDSEGNKFIADSLDFRRMTINRAKLILYTKPEFQLPYPGSITVKAYNVDSETDSTFQDDQIQDFLTATFTDSCQADSFVVDLTPIIQGYVGGEVDNFGTFMRSTLRSKDFNYIEFYGPDDTEATEEQKPRIEIMYTPPFLQED